MKHVGRYARRFRANPEEKRFAEAWEKTNENHKTLAWLLHEGDQTGDPQKLVPRDIEVAATVIQWLGSEVGSYFLAELGYTKPLPKEDSCRVAVEKKRPREKR